MLERGAEPENMLPYMVTFTDNSDVKAWYYNAIQEAANYHDYSRTFKKLEGEKYLGEKWEELYPATDWEALEASWIAAYGN